MHAGGLLCVSRCSWSDVFAEVGVDEEDEEESILVRFEVEFVSE